MASNMRFDYVSGSAARAFEFPEEKITKSVSKKRLKQAVKTKKVSKKTVVIIACLFAMLMVITYRNNMISESNLELLNLKSELNKVQSNLAATAMNVEQSTDLSKVEAYAKQQLGMQKPDKNQVVYIDTSKDANIVKENDTNLLQQVAKWFNEFINNIK